MSVTLTRQASEINIELDKGSDFDFQLFWRSGEGDLESKSPSKWPPLVDTSGMTAELTIRPLDAEDDTTDIVLTSADGDIVVGATLGEISVSMVAADTSTYEWDRATYKLIMTDSVGAIVTLAFGKVRAFNTLEDAD